MMFEILSLDSFDPSLGRVEKHLLQQQTLMELLLEGFEVKGKIYQDDKYNYERWDGVIVDEESHVTGIDWSWNSLQGTIDLQWLPPSLKALSVAVNKLEGSADLTYLPVALEILEIKSNQFTGEICLHNLPEVMEDLNVYDNRLSGSLDLMHLPKYLRRLDLGSNEFSAGKSLEWIAPSRKTPVSNESLVIRGKFIRWERESHAPFEKLRAFEPFSKPAQR